MREYFQHTAAVRYSASHFLASTNTGSVFAGFLNWLMSHNVEGDFRVGPAHIAATPRGLARVQTDLGEVLRLMELANLYNKRIDHVTWQAIREAMLHRHAVELKRLSPAWPMPAA